MNQYRKKKNEQNKKERKVSTISNNSSISNYRYKNFLMGKYGTFTPKMNSKSILFPKHKESKFKTNQNEIGSKNVKSESHSNNFGSLGFSKGNIKNLFKFYKNIIKILIMIL